MPTVRLSLAMASFLIATFLSCLVVSSPADAAKRMDKAIYGFSTLPYWKVGTYDSQLSRACQNRQFGQKRQFRYIISFVGEKGQGIIGIATSAWNLHDPDGMANPMKVYHFFHDGYSDCAVYVTTQPVN